MEHGSPDAMFTAALAISVNPSAELPDDRSLGAAAFWVHLRQDIHVALHLQTPIDVEYSPCFPRQKIVDHLERCIKGDVPIEKGEVHAAWAKWIALLLVDVINYCFQDGVRELQNWLHLRQRLDHWKHSKPSNLKPFFERKADLAKGRPFPEIWISIEAGVLMWLYYYATSILLKTHLPGGVNVGIYQSEAYTLPTFDDLESREEVLLLARAICGVAKTNPNAQALIVVCHMVTISAIFFTDIQEQRETIRLIRMTRTVTGHPLADVERRLEAAWGREVTELEI
jgi:hypothetical protein